jgi:phosphate:Na+ symporter
MAGTLVLIELAGYVALLLWGMHMIQSGIVRAYGANLRRTLGAALRSRLSAFLAGLGVTAVLQSSTATGLMTASSDAAGVVDLVPALAVMLGANVGTTLIVQVLSFDIAWLAPLLFIVGVFAFRRGGRTRTRDLGRVAIGLGLLLLSLHLLILTIEPAETAPAMRELFAAVTRAPLVALLLAAVLTWAAHSSVAVVLFIMSLAQAGIVSPASALALVLGANLGSAVNPVLESGGGNPASRRLPVGNLINRVVGCALVLPFLGPIAALLTPLDLGPARQTADFHTVFNLVLAALFILPLTGFARVLQWLLPDEAKGADPGRPLYLDAAAIATPHIAVPNAAREALRMADAVEAMLRGAVTVLDTDDRKLAGELARMDNVVDRLNDAIKRYLTRIDQERLDAAARRRYSEILAFATNLEHVGDVVEKSLSELAAKKIKHRLKFSAEGRDEIHAMLTRLIENLRLAVAVFMSGDPQAARRLLTEKKVFRDLERMATENHFARLREGRLESVETSALHLDILRDAKRINSHLAAVAYPVLEHAAETTK